MEREYEEAELKKKADKKSRKKAGKADVDGEEAPPPPKKEPKKGKKQQKPKEEKNEDIESDMKDLNIKEKIEPVIEAPPAKKVV